jgi:hypothetical protein
LGVTLAEWGVDCEGTALVELRRLWGTDNPEIIMKKSSSGEWVENYVRGLAEAGSLSDALCAAIQNGHIELVREFIQKGIDVNGRTVGYAPLMVAGGGPEVIRLLIEAGADVNARDDKEGKTPLICHLGGMYPARILEKVVRVLLEAGADPNIRANSGWSALDLANNGRPKKVVELLLKAGALPGEPGAFEAMTKGALNIDALRTKIERRATGYVAVTAGLEVELPDPNRLKLTAVESLLEAIDPPDEKAASVLHRCELNYDIAKGKDDIDQLIELVIAAPPEAYEILREEGNRTRDIIFGALLEACPDIGSDRVIRRG